MKFSGKMCFEIISKVTKKQGFRRYTFQKPQGGGQYDPHPRILGLNISLNISGATSLLTFCRKLRCIYRLIC